MSVQQALERTAEKQETPGLVVVDERGEIFQRLRSMELDTAIWRTMRTPSAAQLPASTVVILAVYAEPAWEQVRECARVYPTVVAATSARTEDSPLALRAGAFGYVDMAMRPDGLRRTLLGIIRGEPAFPREVLGVWLREGHVPGRTAARSARADRLTARQREIVGLIAGGATDKEIGAALGIRTATAQKHVANLLRRLGVANRAGAVGLLFKEGEVLPQVQRPDKRRR